MEGDVAVSLQVFGMMAPSAKCSGLVIPSGLLPSHQPSISSICQLPAWEGYANDMQMTPRSEALNYHLSSNHSYRSIRP